MKNILALFIISAISFSTFGQTVATEMKVVGSEVYIGNTPITLNDAKDMAMAASPMAYMFFSKAKQIRGWNIFRGVAGVYELAGAMVWYNIESTWGFHHTISLSSLGLGTAIVASIVPRETKRTQQIIMGVKAYNEAIAE